MSTLQVFDKALCCSTGICGPQVDPVLPQFAADLDWLKSRGVAVERFNLAQQPMAFAANEVIRELLATEGPEVLPVTVVDGQVKSRSRYPSRRELGTWAGISSPLLTPLPMLSPE